jgi:hypothetical protein
MAGHALPGTIRIFGACITLLLTGSDTEVAQRKEENEYAIQTNPGSRFL